MKEATFRKYASIKEKIADLEKQLVPLKEVIIQEIVATGQNTCESLYGDFSLRVNKTWEYSTVVMKLKAELDLQKSIEETKNIAKLKESKNVLVFKAN